MSLIDKKFRQGQRLHLWRTVRRPASAQNGRQLTRHPTTRVMILQRTLHALPPTQPKPIHRHERPTARLTGNHLAAQVSRQARVAGRKIHHRTRITSAQAQRQRVRRFETVFFEESQPSARVDDPQPPKPRQLIWNVIQTVASHPQPVLRQINRQHAPGKRPPKTQLLTAWRAVISHPLVRPAHTRDTRIHCPPQQTRKMPLPRQPMRKEPHRPAQRAYPFTRLNVR